MKNIVFIGMTGSGKTTIGRILANFLKRPFIDLDEAIVSYSGESIADMFEKGEAYFRDQESAITKIVSSHSGQIIATGGGIILRPENMSHLKDNGTVIFIDRDIDAILSTIEADSRPLLKENTKSTLEEMEEARHPLYFKYSDYVIKNDSDLDTLLEEIYEIIEKSERNQDEN